MKKIFKLFKILACILWHGEHDYRAIGPELHCCTSRLYKCKRCGYERCM